MSELNSTIFFCTLLFSAFVLFDGKDSSALLDCQNTFSFFIYIDLFCFFFFSLTCSCFQETKKKKHRSFFESLTTVPWWCTFFSIL